MAILKTSRTDSKVDVLITCVYHCAKCGKEQIEVGESADECKECPDCGSPMKIISSTSESEAE